MCKITKNLYSIYFNDSILMILNKSKYLLVLLPIVTVLIGNYFIPINVIYYDEIVPIAFVNNSFHFSSIFQIIKEIFAPHHEHILIIIKLIYSLNYFVNQSINLPELMVWGTFFQIFFLYQLQKNLKLGWRTLSVFSLTLFLPFYQDLYYHSMSLNNILINIFIFQSLVFLANGKPYQSLFFLVLSLFDSAQSYLFLPIWICLNWVLNKNKIASIIPLLIFIGIYFITRIDKPNEGYTIKSNLISFIHNPYTWTYLNPPFNLSSIYFQFVGLLLFIYMTYTVVKNEIFRKPFSEFIKKNIVLVGFLTYSFLCFSSVFVMRNIVMPRYFIYSGLNFSIIFVLYSRQKNTKNWGQNLVILFCTISFFQICKSSIPSLKNYYLEKRFIYENYKNNKFVNYFPNEEFRNKLNEPHPYINRKFKIPNGINGGINSHLQIFNDFIPISLKLLPVDPKKNIHLKIRNLVTLNKFQKYNYQKANKINKILGVQTSSDNWKTIFYVKCKSVKNTFYFPIIENKSHHFNLEIYSNQLPYGLINISIIKGTLSLN